MYSAAGTVEGWNVMDPKWADLAPGYRYCICLANGTDNDITSADLTVEGADASEEDICRPGDFSTLEVEPECSQPLILGVIEATIKLDADHPIKAHSQCQVSVPCPKRFIRVTGSAGGLDVTLVIRDLKRSGMQEVDAAVYPFGYQEPVTAGVQTVPPRTQAGRSR